MITYSKIYESVAFWLDREDLDSSIPQFVRLAELEIYRRLRIRLNEYTKTFTAADDPYNPLPLPDNFKEMRLLVVNGKPLECISDQEYFTRLDGYTGTDRPNAFCEIDNHIYILPWPSEPEVVAAAPAPTVFAVAAVDPTPEQEEEWGDTEIVMHYYGIDSSDLMDRGEDAYIYGGVYQAWLALSGPSAGATASGKAAEFGERFNNALFSLEKDYKRSRYAGSTVQVSSVN